MTSAIIARPLDDAMPQRRDEPAGLAIEIVPGLDEVAASWRALEADAVMSPYGRFDWVAAYQASLPEAERRTRVAVLRGADDEIAMLLPLQIERRGPLTVAAAIGGKHANYNLPILQRDFAHRLTPEGAARILAEAGRALRVDMISIPNMPVTWNGWRNPFAIGGQPSASDAWALRLQPDGEAALVRSMSAEARKKMRNKGRAITKVGPVSFLRAGTPAEVERILDAYLRQKAQRFAELGISDPFADPGLQGFLREAATTGLLEGRPAIEFHALTVANEVVAVLGGAVDGHRFSGMVVSFQAGPLDKFSPGEMLVANVVRDLGARGYAVFDLGVGDARYKRSICEEVEPLVDVAVTLTWRGRAAGLAEAALLGAKRRLKANPRAMALVSRLRRLKARLRG